MSMTLDIVLALAALVVAVIGTLKDDFSTRTKRILVGVAATTCLFAVVKAVLFGTGPKHRIAASRNHKASVGLQAL